MYLWFSTFSPFLFREIFGRNSFWEAQFAKQTKVTLLGYLWGLRGSLLLSVARKPFHGGLWLWSTGNHSWRAAPCICSGLVDMSQHFISIMLFSVTAFCRWENGALDPFTFPLPRNCWATWAQPLTPVVLRWSHTVYNQRKHTRVSSQVGWDRVQAKRVSSCCPSLADMTSSLYMGLTPVVHPDYWLQRLWDVCNSQPINLALLLPLEKVSWIMGHEGEVIIRIYFYLWTRWTVHKFQCFNY